VKSLSLGGAVLAALLFLGVVPAHAGSPQPDRAEASGQGNTLSLRALPDPGARAAEYVECSWQLGNPYIEWWWNASYTLTSVGVEAEALVECDPDIYSIESELYVRHDETLISVDREDCVSDDGDECASSTPAARHDCTAGTACAGDWTQGLELRLQLEDNSWDPDTFPDYCTIQGADDEIARCYLEGDPYYVPPTFPPTGQG
jgi:hypothetical protein